MRHSNDLIIITGSKIFFSCKPIFLDNSILCIHLSFPHRVETALIIWSTIFILLGRALNIFPLAELSNRFRTHKITKKMMVIMWFSGLRGAIAYALSLHLEFEEDVRKVIVTTTLVVVLFDKI